MLKDWATTSVDVMCVIISEVVNNKWHSYKLTPPLYTFIVPEATIH